MEAWKAGALGFGRVPVSPGLPRAAPGFASGPGVIVNSMPFQHESLWKPHSAGSGKDRLHSCLVFVRCVVV